MSHVRSKTARAVDAGADLGDRRVESLLAEPVPLAHVVGHVADDEGARHVRVDRGGVVAREDVDDERRVRPDRARSHVVTDRALRAGRDDVLVGGRVVRGEDDVHVRLHALDRELLAVEQQLVAADLRAPEQLATRVHRRLGGTLRPPHPRELGLGLGAPAVVEELLVDVELDPVGAEAVGEPDGEVRRARSRASARGSPTARSASCASSSRRSIPDCHQLVEAELLGHVDVEEPELAEAGGLHRADEDVPAAVLLGVEERIGHAERHRMPHVRRSGRSRRRSGPRRPQAQRC